MNEDLFGLRVVVAPDVPKMQLSARVCEVLAPEFIAETNAWMREFFGMQCLIPDGETYVVGGRALHMNARTFAVLRQHTASAPGAEGAVL